MMKVCRKCKLEKDDSEYYVQKRKNYRNATCKSCVKEKSKRYRKDNAGPAHLKKMREMNRKYRQGLRDDALNAYGGKVCACCGEMEERFLTLDHIENNGATERLKIAGRRNAAGTHTYKWLRARSFPPGYQVLCMNCNFGKRMNGGVCPHRGRCNDYPEREYVQVDGSAALAA